MGRRVKWRGWKALALVMGAVSLLGAWQWHGQVEGMRLALRGYTFGLTRSTAMALRTAIRDDGSLDPVAATHVLERAVAVRSERLRFAALVVGGRVVARTAEAPAGLETAAAGEELDLAGHVVVLTSTRDVDPRVPPPPPPDQPHPRRPPPSAEELAGGRVLPLGPSELDGVLAFGFSTELDGEHLRMFLRELASRAGFLILGAGGLAAAYAAGRREQRSAVALEAERVRSRDLAEVGVTAAELAHEMKNPLGIVLALAQQMSEDQAAPEQCRARARRIVDACDRATARLGEFIHYSRLRDPARASVDLRALVSTTLEVLDQDARASSVTLHQDVDALSVEADPDMLQQIVLNLALNAVQGSPPGGRVTVRARSSGSHAWLEVEDTGRGIAPPLLARLFEPYATGRPGGHGLGLAIVRRLVELHGWAVQVESEVGAGTRVRLDGLETLRVAPSVAEEAS